ncbi:retrotransposon protein [Cucumis melo var. makuwa]|uniref:Retrotransposon protein n=1 Tax=Cucumis melo var. makuwa TaxID=1194695 RepID=A0A5A7UJR9_CUCMM|nr:retrotransposon protein [Cucumis melo var. makuwa]TYK08922.1 retrotransposon protein [Cucumis melo var. makuwa]
MDQQKLLAVLTVFTLAKRQILLTLKLLMNNNRRITYTPSDTRHRIRQFAYFCMIHESDLVCRQSTRMDRRTFAILCHFLQTVSGISSTEIDDIEEMVEMFLHVLAHDVKNRVIQREFVWSELPWHVRRDVHKGERSRNRSATFRTRKEKIATNVLGVCDTKGDFVYVLAGWEGPVVDSRILRDALSRENGLQVPKGQRYHLQEWRGGGNAPTNAKEYFNMKHSSARNVIERAFGVLKGRWVILRGKSYYPLQVQCRTILACCLLHNLINRKMTYCDDVDEGDSTYTTTVASEDIQYIETKNEWSQWRDELAESMFTDWKLRNT